MNAFFFGAKRAFQSTLRITRPWLTRLGLTAARFDMLTAISRYPLGPLQSDLRRALGVSAATISRMARSLEDLGLVRRERSPDDRRTLQIRLTPAGLVRLRRATRILILSGAVQLAVDCALVGGKHCHDEWRCMTEMSNAESLFGRVRSAYRDHASLNYPWHPDD